MQNNRLSYLFERYLNGTSTTAEDIELSTYILAPEHASTIERLKEEFWEKTKGEPMVNEEAEKHLQRILQPSIRKTSFISWKRMAVAASLILAISTASYFIFFHKETKKEELVKVESKDIEPPKQSKAIITLADGKTVSIDSFTTLTQNNVSLIKTADGRIVYTGKSSEVVYNTLANPRGSKVINMQLADGSYVWLNAGSSITYPIAFAGNERKVAITGEAYFEVAHDATKPFYVSKGAMQVQVLGTHFNVNAYDDEMDVKVTLLEGSVQVDNKNSTEVLMPGQQAQMVEGIKVVNSVNLEEVMSWKNGYFGFDNTDLQTVMRQIARWYDVEIVYEGKMPEMKFGGEISRNSTVSEVLKILEKSKVRFRIEGRKIVIIP